MDCLLTPVVLSQVQDDVVNQKGAVWTHVISLWREDAAIIEKMDVRIIGSINLIGRYTKQVLEFLNVA